MYTEILNFEQIYQIQSTVYRDMPLMASLFLMQRICRRPLIQLQWDLKNYNCRNISIEITKKIFVNIKGIEYIWSVYTT